MRTTVAIIGGGPAGSATAMFLARAGIDSTIVERRVFPRFRVGEGTTGEAGRIVRELGLEAVMAEHGYAVKTGSTVLGADGRNSFFVPVMRRDPELGLQPTSTWQVRRSTFDASMLDCAEATGVTLVQGRASAPVLENGRVRGISLSREDGRDEVLDAEMVVDASGPATFLANAGVTGPKHRGNYDRQIAVFSHFVGDTRNYEGAPNATIFFRARHFWAWLIPMDDESASVGVVTPAEYFRQQGLNTGAFLARELEQLHPVLAERMAGATMIEDVHAVSNYSYHVRRFAGPGHLCVGDSHRFIDPIFAFGVHIALHEAKRAADAIAEVVGGGGESELLAEYQRYCEGGGDVFQDLIDGFWSNSLAFSVFVHERYREDFIDMFAGRAYDTEPSPGLQALRKIISVGGSESRSPRG